MNALLPLLLLLATQTPGGAEDAFRANYVAIQAEANYRVHAGTASVESLNQLRSWTTPDVAFLEQPRRALKIDWACDGVAQRILCISANPPPPPETLKPPANANVPLGGVSQRGPFPPSLAYADKGFEVLWDGEIQVEHRLDQPDVEVHRGDELGMLYTTSGPFLLWATMKYPSHIKTKFFPKCVPVMHHAALNARDLLVAVYEDEFEPDGWARLEIWHDPSIGFLPRFARYVVGVPPGGKCSEYFLIEARRCSAGGFVPTRVYEADFAIDRPKQIQASEFDSQAPAPTPRNLISMRRLLATELRDHKGPVGLEMLDKVEVIAATGGRVSLTTKTPLTIDRLKATLGRKLTDRARGRVPSSTPPN